jgi:RNA polymerase sigma-70 factor, ECF subfamily
MEQSADPQPALSSGVDARGLVMVSATPSHAGSPMDGIGLVEQSMRGDTAAFNTLMRGEVKFMFGVASLILRDRQLCEDAVQQALVRAWRDLPRLREPERFSAWLRRLVVNSCYDEARREHRHDHETFERGQTAVVSDHARDVVERERVDHAFRRLPVEQRAVLVLHHHLQLTHPEIAELLGIPIGTVKSRIRRGLDNLRASLAVDDRPPIGQRERSET